MPLVDVPQPIDDAERAFRSRQLITCIGNKRALLGPIETAVQSVRSRLGGRRLRVVDAFTGSGAVARMLKPHAQRLVVNDLEAYAAVAGRCYLANRGDVDRDGLRRAIDALNRGVNEPTSDGPGFIERLYAPADESAITAEDRVFYTRANARRLDRYRAAIDGQPDHLRPFLLAPLLSAASVHANTAGVFKGFYKDKVTGIGKFGGTGGDALRRIRGEVRLQMPVFSAFDSDVQVHRSDANEVVRSVGGFDLAYFDPPYNQHPYGSNYFMLNLLVDYEEPAEISRVSGIPRDWRRSDYNVKRKILPRLADLVADVDARFVLLSFNNEGFVSPTDLRDLLAQHGTVEQFALPYTTFRGSRNLRNRSKDVTEHLFLLEKGVAHSGQRRA